MKIEIVELEGTLTELFGTERRKHDTKIPSMA